MSATCLVDPAAVTADDHAIEQIRDGHTDFDDPFLRALARWSADITATTHGWATHDPGAHPHHDSHQRRP